MSNYTNENLIITTITDGSRAIKIGDKIFAFDESGGGGGGNGIDAALITQYTPYRAEFSAPSSFVVTGFGVNEYEEDYSDWNGTYTVTSETESLSGIQRKYQKGDESKYLIGWYDEDMYMSNIWGFCTSPTNTSVWSATVFKSSEPISGTSTWNNEDIGWSASLTLTQNNATYPEIPEVIRGKMVTEATSGKFTISNSVTTLNGWKYAEPTSLSALYVVNDGYTIGNYFALPYSELASIPSGWQSLGYGITTTTNGPFTVTENRGYEWRHSWNSFNMKDDPDYGWFVQYPASVQDPFWFVIQLPNAIVPGALYYKNAITTTDNFRDAKLQGSNDGSTWTDLVTITDNSTAAAYEQMILIDGNTAYTHFRFIITATWEGGLTLQQFNIYEKTIN